MFELLYVFVKQIAWRQNTADGGCTFVN